MGSPFSVLVDNPPDPQHCTVSGPGVGPVVARDKSNPVSFKVHLADSDNEPCITEQSVTATLRMVRSEAVVEKNMNMLSSSVYQFSYIPLEPGIMKVEVNVNGVSIGKSPFEVCVNNLPDLTLCKIITSYTKLQAVKKNKTKQLSFDILLVDSHNEPCIFEQDISIDMVMRTSGFLSHISKAISCKVFCKLPSLYQVHFTPVEAGEMEVSIMVNGAHIKHSPWNVHVHNSPDPRHCFMSCPDLLHKKDERPVSSGIHLRDSYNEPCVYEEDISIAMVMRKPSVPATESMPIENLDIIFKSPSQYCVSFIPDKAGEWIVDVMVSNVPIIGSPLKLRIDNPPCIEHCGVWDLQEHLKKDTHYTFRIRLADSENKKCEFPQHVTAILKMITSQSPVPVKMTYKTPSEYTISFIPHRAGWLTGYLIVNGTTTRSVKILITNTPDPEHCTALGPELELVKKHKSNPVSFQVTLADSDYEPCVSQEKVEVTLKMKNSGLQIHAYQDVLYVLRCYPSLYDVSYTPVEAGEMEASTMVNGAHIKHSPWNVLVHNQPDPEHCTALGPGLGSVKKHKSNPVCFQVRLADSDNEPCVSRQEVKVTLKMKSSGLEIPVEIKMQNDPPAYDVSYTPAEAGEMEVSIMVNGAHIKHSPWNVHVHNPPDPWVCWVLGSDLQQKKGETKPISAHIHLRDFYNELCISEENISISTGLRKCSAFATEFMPIENVIICKSPSLYQVSFIPNAVGEWMVNVMINGVPVFGSPLKLVIDNPPCIEQCEILNLQEQFQKVDVTLSESYWLTWKIKNVKSLSMSLLNWK